MTRFIFVATAFCLLTCAGAASADTITTYSAYGDFSTTPTGAWSYLYANTVGGALTDLSTPISYDGAPGLSDNEPVPNSISIIANTTPATIIASTTIYIQPGTLNLDPESGTVVVRWTAPSAGTYDITGDFIGDDIDEHNPAVSVTDSQSGAVLLSSTISHYNDVANIDFIETLAAGQFISFIVSDNGDYTDLSTGFSATITSESAATVPEPASAALFIAGVIGLAASVVGRKTLSSRP